LRERSPDNSLAFRFMMSIECIAGQDHEGAILNLLLPMAFLSAVPVESPLDQGQFKHPWDVAFLDPVAAEQKDKMDAAFKFITKNWRPYYCFHTLTLIDEGSRPFAV